MPFNPPLCLYCSGQINSSVAGHSPAYGLFGFNITLLMQNGQQNGQRYRHPTGPVLSYNFTHLKKGMYFSNDINGKGRAWRIKTVVPNPNTNPNFATVLLEDVNKYNLMTTTTSFDNASPGISSGYIYELNTLGLPILPEISQTPTPQFVSQQISRFLASSTADGKNVKWIHANISTLSVGNTIYFDSTNLTFKKSNNIQAKNSIGIVSKIGPESNYFTFEPFGTFYEDVANFFSTTNSDSFLRDISGVDTGSLIYINTNGDANSYTTVMPTTNALPIWLYLGQSTYDTEMAILDPFLSSAGTGATGCCGPPGGTTAIL